MDQHEENKSRSLDHQQQALPPVAEPPRSQGDGDSREPTNEEIEHLRHVIDEIPRKVWVALFVSGAERFTYYAISTPWRE